MEFAEDASAERVGDNMFASKRNLCSARVKIYSDWVHPDHVTAGLHVRTASGDYD